MVMLADFDFVLLQHHFDEIRHSKIRLNVLCFCVVFLKSEPNFCQIVSYIILSVFDCHIK